MGVVCGIINRYSPNKIASTFGAGAKGIVVGALIVGIARGVEMALSDALILDTIVHAIASLVNTMPQCGNVFSTVTGKLRHHIRYGTGSCYHAVNGTCSRSDRNYQTDSCSCIPVR